MVRSANLAGMEWAEVDTDAVLWAIPADKMKMATDHLVPLSQQTLHILTEIRPVTGCGRYVFAGRGKGYIAENSTLQALYGEGDYKEKMTIHVMEAVLAHAVPDVNGTAYNRATYLPQWCGGCWEQRGRIS